MPTLTAEQQTALAALTFRVQRRAADPRAQTILQDLGAYLQACEQQLIALMNNTAPPAAGDIEFGPVLYWIHNDLPNDAFFNWLASQFPPSQITTVQWQQWETTWAGAGVVTSDGTLVGSRPFEQLDRGWLFSSVLYVLTMFGEITPPAFGSTPYQSTISGKSSLKIALVGDWGTGNWPDNGTTGPAAAIMQQIQSLSPDVIIHVGDVYYSGTGNLSFAVNAAMILLSGETGVTYDWNEE